MLSCPDEAVLRLLGTDALGDATYAAVEAHIEGCDGCKTVLERLARRCPAFSGALPGPNRWPEIPGFAIRGELGRGATGVVYLAVEEGLDRLVALKVLPASNGSDDDAGPRRRWLREARTVASVRHPNVVPLYGSGEADGWFYMALEYIPGSTLKRRLGIPLPPRSAAALVETIARAVECFHGLGILHLDLKPSNILIDGEEDAPWDRLTPRVSDFGLALSDHDQETGPTETSLAGPRGTPSYMAPEQAVAARGPIGPASDVHALGAILYELLTGRPPYQGASMLETLEQVRTQEPVPPRRLNAKIPHDLETIALRCLEKPPSRRYATARAMADDLRRWLDGRPIAARPASTLEKGWRWCRRRPAIAALTASLALMFGVGLPTISFLWRRAESERERADVERRLAQVERDRADAARRHAEADLQTATEVLGEIVELSTRWGLNVPRVIGPERSIAMLLQTRKRLLDLASRRPDQSILRQELWSVENGLFGLLFQAGRCDDARSILEESLSHCSRIIARHPQERWGLRWHTLCSFLLAQLAERQGIPAESVRHLRRAVRSGEALIGIMPKAEYLNLLAECRRALARFLTLQGRPEEADSLLLANQRMLENPGAVSKDARMAAMRVLSHLDLAHPRPGSSPALFSASWRRRSTLDRVDAPSRLASLRGDSLPAHEWAGLAVESLAANGGPDALLNEYDAGYELCTLLGSVAAEHRRVGQLQEARRTVERIMAVARLLVIRYPDQPAAHLALSEAYTQASKNAWRPRDNVAIDRNLSLALDAALQALALNPRFGDALYQVNTLQQKLHNLRHP